MKLYRLLVGIVFIFVAVRVLLFVNFFAAVISLLAGIIFIIICIMSDKNKTDYKDK